MTKEINSEKPFKGFRISGFIMLLLDLIILPAAIAYLIYQISQTGISEIKAILYGISIGFLVILWFITLCGYATLEPNSARVMIFFGKYKGTFTNTGFYWFNPFYTKKRLSLRARNLDVEPIKVNDKVGNPIMVGLVLVWKLKDTYKAMFEIDSQTMATTDQSNGVISVSARMKAFENFVKIQSDAALRQVVTQYNYDNNEGDQTEITLRSGGEEINEILEKSLNDRLAMAGIEVIEARINYLAYAPEIAAVMLRRQQASAIISAREKIVEGAVSMVKMALEKLGDEDIVELDNEKKAAMVSNMLVVLCADESAQPVVNTGTLYN
ncbi:MAG: SPFH domain-containing protein [Bacteroidales bacterium]|nr:SPFH domain-containing protein [Bacteroidales bacterium]